MQHVLSLQKFTSPKFSTIFIIMINLHHSITSLCETNWDTIFNLSPRALGLAEHYDDLEDLTTEKPDVNERLRKEAIWKASNAYYKHWCMIRWHTERTKHLQLQGTLVLLGGITLHMFISSIYHLATTGWNYGDVWVLRTSLGEKLHFGNYCLSWYSCRYFVKTTWTSGCTTSLSTTRPSALAILSHPMRQLWGVGDISNINLDHGNSRMLCA